MNNENRTPHWIPCPACNEKTDVKIYEDTVLLKFPLRCPNCGRETIINIMQLRMTTEHPPTMPMDMTGLLPPWI